MHDQIAVQMMRRCLETIESQRAQIAHLAPKAEAYDRIGALIDMQAGNRNRSLGAEADMTWNLRTEIERATERMSREKSGMNPRAEPDGKAIFDDLRDHSDDEQENIGRAGTAQNVAAQQVAAEDMPRNPRAG
jgi:hypothetical protein